MFGVLCEKSYHCWYKANGQAVLHFLAIIALLSMPYAMAQTSFAGMPQADNVAYMQQGRAQAITTDFITQFETMPSKHLASLAMHIVTPRAAPVAQVSSVTQAAPATQVVPAPQTQSVPQKTICRFLHALFDLLPVPKSAPAPIKPDTALGIRG